METVRAEASEDGDVGAVVCVVGAVKRGAEGLPSEVVPWICASDVGPGVLALAAWDVGPVACGLGEVNAEPGDLGPEGLATEGFGTEGFGTEELEVGNEGLALVGTESEVSGLVVRVGGRDCTSGGTDARGRGSDAGRSDSTAAGAAPGDGGRGTDLSMTEPAMTVGGSMAAAELPADRGSAPVLVGVIVDVGVLVWAGSIRAAGGRAGSGASTALAGGGAGTGSLAGVELGAGGWPRCRVVSPRVEEGLVAGEAGFAAEDGVGPGLGVSTGGVRGGSGRTSVPRMRKRPEGATTSFSLPGGGADGSTGSGCFDSRPARRSVGSASRGGRIPRGGVGRGPGTVRRRVGAGTGGLVGVRASMSSFAQGFSGMVIGSGSAESTSPWAEVRPGRRPDTTRLPLMIPVKLASRPCASGSWVTPVGRRVTV